MGECSVQESGPACSTVLQCSDWSLSPSTGSPLAAQAFVYSAVSAAGRVYQSVIRRWAGDNHQERSETSDTQKTFSLQALQLILPVHAVTCSTDPDLAVTSGLRRSNAAD